jgi:hypothetical protein
MADRSSRLVVTVATVVAAPGSIPEVATAVRLKAWSEAAGSGAASAGRIAAEAATAAPRVGDHPVATAAAARGGLLVGRGTQHWDGTRGPGWLGRLRGRQAGRIGPGPLVAGAGGLLLGHGLATDDVRKAESHPGVGCTRAVDGALVGVGSQNVVEGG